MLDVLVRSPSLRLSVSMTAFLLVSCASSASLALMASSRSTAYLDMVLRMLCIARCSAITAGHPR